MFPGLCRVHNSDMNQGTAAVPDAAAGDRRIVAITARALFDLEDSHELFDWPKCGLVFSSPS